MFAPSSRLKLRYFCYSRQIHWQYLLPRTQHLLGPTRMVGLAIWQVCAIFFFDMLWGVRTRSEREKMLLPYREQRHYISRDRLPAFSFPSGVSQVNTLSGEKVLKWTLSSRTLSCIVIIKNSIYSEGDFGLSGKATRHLQLCGGGDLDKDSGGSQWGCSCHWLTCMKVLR